MINDPFSPEEQAIIQQIQAVPRLQLGSAAREAIRGRMLDEFRGISQQAAAKAAAQTRLVFLTVTGLIVITVIVVIIVAIISRQNAPQSATSTAPAATSQATTALTATSSVMIPATVTTQSAVDVSETGAPDLATLPTELISPTEALASQPPTSASSTESADAGLPTSTIDAGLMTPSVTAISDAPLSTSAGTATLDAIIVIQGPVINIVNNVITIYDFDIEVEPNHPILYLIEIGDLLRVEGAYGNSGNVVASVVSNLSDTPLVSGATVSLDGPVESINGNVIVVNGISVQLDANDPLLQTVQIGQLVSVQGNFQGSGSNIMLIVVTIVINTNTNTGGGGGGSNCVWKENGMSGMGKWKCKGSKKSK